MTPPLAPLGVGRGGRGPEGRHDIAFCGWGFIPGRGRPRAAVHRDANTTLSHLAEGSLESPTGGFILKLLTLDSSSFLLP